MMSRKKMQQTIDKLPSLHYSKFLYYWGRQMWWFGEPLYDAIIEEGKRRGMCSRLVF